MDTHPSKSLTVLSWLFLFSVITSITFSSCNKRHKLVKIDKDFAKYIEAYTSGVISKKNSIRIQLAVDAVTTHALNEPVKESLFDFSPTVKGKAYWVDARTIEFKPEKDLKPGELYEVSFNLGKVSDVPSKFRQFKFNIQTTKPAFKVEEAGLRSTGKELLALTGQIFTADIEESKNIERLLTASLNGVMMKVNWQHNEANKTHSYVIDNIKRTSAPGTLVLSWNGKALDIGQSDKKELQVPAAGDFKVLAVRAIQQEEQCVLVQFSDPVKIGQMLEGLISVSDQSDISYTITGSEVKVYSSQKLDGNYTVYINEGIENQWGEKLQKGFTANVYFENRLPSVKIHGSGNVLPNSGGRIVLPFDAINLKAVDVSVIKIHERNIAQFLQRNNIGGDEELRRVAKPLVQATIRLDNDKTINLNRKNRFSLDLDKYIQAEPGAVYRVTIGFRPDYSTYTLRSDE
jgi:alpha-2-macroglobulin